jgi:hypothetical protein
MKKIIDAAGNIGMAVTVSLFYGSQSRFLQDDNAVYEAVKTGLRDQKFTNIVIKIANEHNVDAFHIYLNRWIVILIDVSKRKSGGLPVGGSGTGQS